MDTPNPGKAEEPTTGDTVKMERPPRRAVPDSSRKTEEDPTVIQPILRPPPPVGTDRE